MNMWKPEEAIIRKHLHQILIEEEPRTAPSEFTNTPLIGVEPTPS